MGPRKACSPSPHLKACNYTAVGDTISIWRGKKSHIYFNNTFAFLQLFVPHVILKAVLLQGRVFNNGERLGTDVKKDRSNSA